MLHFGKAGRKSNCRQTCCWTTNSTQSKYGHIDRKLIYSKLLISKSNKVLQVWHRLEPPCLSIPLCGKFIWKPRKSVQWHGCICFIGKKKRDSLYFPSRSMFSLSLPARSMCHLVFPHNTFQSHAGSNVTPPPTRYFQQTELLVRPAQYSLTNLTVEIN